MAQIQPSDEGPPPESREEKYERVVQERHLKEMDGETLFAMRGESVDSVVYAALDHKRLAKYLLAEWDGEIGPGPEHAGESAAEVAMKLLDELKERRLADGRSSEG